MLKQDEATQVGSGAGATSRRQYRGLRSALVTGLVAAPLVANPPPAGAATSINAISLVCLGDADHCVYNYEFVNNTSTLQNDVDWLLSIVWWNNADVNTIKDTIGWSGTGSTKYMLMLNGAKNYVYDQDNGIKNDGLLKCSNDHVYPFAPPDTDRMYEPNGGWGWVVFGSDHQDHHEGAHPTCSNPEAYGWSEVAEKDIGAIFSEAGWQVNYDYLNSANTQNGWDCTLWPPGCDSKHYWQNNGFASIIAQ